MNYNDFPDLFGAKTDRVKKLIESSIRKLLVKRSKKWLVGSAKAFEYAKLYHIRATMDDLNSLMRFFGDKKAFWSYSTNYHARAKSYGSWFQIRVGYRLAQTIGITQSEFSVEYHGYSDKWMVYEG